MNKKSIFCLLLCLCLTISLVFTACGGNSASTADQSAKDTDAKKNGIDYMALVNKNHGLPENWEDNLKTVHMTNSVGDDVEVEKKAYDAYLKLKAALEEEGVTVDLDSARRSVADQQRIMDEFTERYGADYAAKTVAKPGYSEHQTGLALDLYLIIDGKDITENEDMVQYPEIWAKIHAKLADCGFILRYLDGKEYITGYGYEPWHIRYIDNADTASEIMSKGITFEEYLGTASSAPVTIDYGTSEHFTQDEMKEAVVAVECQFAAWEGCELHTIRYAGDDVSDEKLKLLQSSRAGADLTNAAVFLMDFHSPVDNSNSAFESDREYTDYQWILTKTKDDGWQIFDFGYGA